MSVNRVLCHSALQQPPTHVYVTHHHGHDTCSSCDGGRRSHVTYWVRIVVSVPAPNLVVNSGDRNEDRGTPTFALPRLLKPVARLPWAIAWAIIVRMVGPGMMSRRTADAAAKANQSSMDMFEAPVGFSDDTDSWSLVRTASIEFNGHVRSSCRLLG